VVTRTLFPELTRFCGLDFQEMKKLKRKNFYKDIESRKHFGMDGELAP
jgi:hypothetical protein